MTTPIFSVCLSGLSHKLLSTKKKKEGKSKNLITYNNNLEIVMMWWLLLCGFISHWSRRKEFHTRNKTLSPPFKPNPLFSFLLSSSSSLLFPSSSLVSAILWSDPMKEITDSVDPRIMFKHQSLLQDYHELRKVIRVPLRFHLDLAIWNCWCWVDSDRADIR